MKEKLIFNKSFYLISHSNLLLAAQWSKGDKNYAKVDLTTIFSCRARMEHLLKISAL